MTFYWLNEMDPLERWKAVLRGESVDRVPLHMNLLGHSAIALGYQNLGDFYSKPEVCIKCQMIAREMYGYDQPPELISPGYGAAEWGSEVELPYRPAMSAPAVRDPVVKTAEDLEKLEIPDPRTAAYMKEYHDMVKLALEYKQFPLVTIFGGCVSATAPQVVEVEQFMIWTRLEPGLCRKALDKTAEFAIRMAEYFAEEFGTDGWIPADWLPTDANVLISAETFEKLVLPSLARVHQKVLDLGLQAWFTHWCSDHLNTINAGLVEKVPMGDPGILYFGPENDLKFIAERFGKRHIITGSVDPTTILIGSFDEVLQLCKQDIEKAKHSPRGYMLGSGCELPPRAPPANVYAFVKASREYGKY